MRSVILLFVIFLTGCNPNQHVWDEIDKCKAKYSESCSVVVIPNSRYRELKELAKDWR